MKTDTNIAANPEPGVQTEDFAERVRVNQTYVLGHSQREIQRLISQAAMLRPVTERLLRRVNIGPGMRVLDLGCGAGDVSMLAAEFVGPTGLVVGIDRNREVLTLAAERARAAGLRQISFEQTSVESFSSHKLSIL